MKTTKHILATITTTILLGWTVPSHAGLFPVGTQWNAYNDFYFSPTASGWGGATSPSALGTAWGYYMGNVNGYDFPKNVGTYLNSGQIYKLSNANPAGASNGTRYSNPLYDATGGNGFPRYLDNIGWGVSLGRYDNPWFSGAPGYGLTGQSNFIWMQSAYLGNGAQPPNGPAEGIASVLTWTAPEAGVYTFAGKFLAGNQPGNSAAVAIVDSLGGAALLSRSVLGNDASQSFSFTASYNAGATVQFQVGNNFSTGNAVGLQVTATAIPEPSSGMLLTAGLGALGVVNLRRRR